MNADQSVDQSPTDVLFPEPTWPEPSTHILVISGECDACPADDDGALCPSFGQTCSRESHVECSGVDRTCRMWEPCSQCDGIGRLSADPHETGAIDRHETLHRWFADGWFTATAACFVQHADTLSDAISELGISEPGRYLVDFVVEEESYLTLTLVAAR